MAFEEGGGNAGKSALIQFNRFGFFVYWRGLPLERFLAKIYQTVYIAPFCPFSLSPWHAAISSRFEEGMK
jgi:hypothetical protein